MYQDANDDNGNDQQQHQEEMNQEPMHRNIPLSQEFSNLDLGILPDQPLHTNTNMHALQKRFPRRI